jgi:tight adherence protein B
MSGAVPRRVARAASAVVAALLLVVGLAAAIGAAAHAAPVGAQATAPTETGRIGPIGTADGRINLIFTGVGLPRDAAIDPATVEVTVGGIPVASQASLVSDASTQPDRTAVLAIDVSSSMEGSGIAGAKQAATAFLGVVPEDVAVALVTFDAVARTLVEPTLDHASVQSAVDGLVTRGGTALYDGVILATDVAGTEGLRNVLLLSDGQDVDSVATLDEAAAAVSASGVQLDAVALGENAADYLGELTTLATAGGGSVTTTADPDELAALFEQSAQTIANQVQVTAEIPEALAGQDARVVVTADASGTTLEDAALVTLTVDAPDPTENQYPPIPVDPGLVIPQPVMYAALGALLLGLGVALYFVLGGFRPEERMHVGRRLSVYSLSGSAPVKEAETTTVLGESAMARSALEMASKVVRRRGFEEDLGHRLDAGGIPLRPAEWLLIHFAFAVLGGLLGLVASQFTLALGLLGLAIGAAGPLMYLSYARDRRQRRFLDQLPDTLQLVAGSLSAGYSLPQAIDAAARESQEPISSELDRALVEARLGIPIEEALEDVAERMGSQDFTWVVLAIGIQRQTGGNLAELLTTVANTLRDREQLRRQVRVLSAEGRLSAWILGLLPVAFAGFLAVTQPEYLAPLLQDPLGWVLLGLGVALVGVGAIWLSRVVKVEV